MSAPDSPFYNQNPQWGIGMYTYITDDGNTECGYGFPWKGMDPDDFTPDPECCNAQEKFNWELSKKFKLQCKVTKDLVQKNNKLAAENAKFLKQLEIALKALRKIEEQDRMSYGGRPYHEIARQAIEEIEG